VEDAGRIYVTGFLQRLLRRGRWIGPLGRDINDDELAVMRLFKLPLVACGINPVTGFGDLLRRSEGRRLAHRSAPLRGDDRCASEQYGLDFEGGMGGFTYFHANVASG
jgi:hypothetical protein